MFFKKNLKAEDAAGELISFGEHYGDVALRKAVNILNVDDFKAEIEKYRPAIQRYQILWQYGAVNLYALTSSCEYAAAISIMAIEKVKT